MSDLFARKHFERGRQFELQDRIDEAIKSYEVCCSMQPAFHEPYYALARIQAGRNKFPAALELLDRALAVEESAPIREWRAYVNGRLRRYDEALADYDAVIEAGEVQARVNQGRMLLALRRYDKAEAVLALCEEPAAKVLLDSLPRYREFSVTERLDDARAVRYLFATCLVLGTWGDGGLALRNSRYLLLSQRHVATTIRRLLALIEARGWVFDAVVGEGARHGPVASALSTALNVPLGGAGPGSRVLLASAVLHTVEEARAVRAPWIARNCKVMHFALGLVPPREPSTDEPGIVGWIGRCAVPWYRVEPYSRQIADDSIKDGPTPGFRVGPPTVDPNTVEVRGRILAALDDERADPYRDAVLEYYLKRHPQVRAFNDEQFRES